MWKSERENKMLYRERNWCAYNFILKYFSSSTSVLHRHTIKRIIQKVYVLSSKCAHIVIKIGPCRALAFIDAGIINHCLSCV